MTEVDLIYLRSTAQAVLFEDEGGDEVWLPRSNISMLAEEPETGEIVSVGVAEWLALREGLV